MTTKTQIKLNKPATFGKHKGKTGREIAAVDLDYLKWLYGKDNGTLSLELVLWLGDDE
jgi:uncharacterized protein (DUF3820 family)